MLALAFLLYAEPRTPKQRGQNTINDVFTKLRTLFKWAEDQELSATPALAVQRDIRTVHSMNSSL